MKFNTDPTDKERATTLCRGTSVRFYHRSDGWGTGTVTGRYGTTDYYVIRDSEGTLRPIHPKHIEPICEATT